MATLGRKPQPLKGGNIMAVKRSYLVVLAAILAVGAIFASSAFAAGWTVLGGDPLFPGGIPNASQQGRDKFVHDMLSSKGVVAQKRAGLNKRERQAFKQALVHGEFTKCTLHYGDHFEAMSYGVGAIFVDRNVTFKDPRYKAHGAPAFCVTVEVGKSGELVRVKVPFKCENFGVVKRKKLKPGPEKPEKPKEKPKPKPRCSKKHPKLCPKPEPRPEIPPAPEEPKKPEEPEKPKPSAPEIAIEVINDFEVNEETVICARVTATAGDSLSITFSAENGGQFAGHGVATPRPGTTNEWCDPYTAPSEVPSSGSDILKAVVVDNTTGLSGKDEKSATIKPERF